MKKCILTGILMLLLMPGAVAQAGEEPGHVTCKEAKRLYETAYVIKMSAPKKSMKLLDRIVKGAAYECVYLCKAMELQSKLEGKPASFCTTPLPLKATKDWKRSKNKEVRDIINRAKRLVVDRKYNEAIPVTKHGLKIEPRNCDLLLVLGVSYASSGYREKAAPAYQKFVDTCPENPRAPAVRKVLKQFREYQEHSRKRNE